MVEHPCLVGVLGALVRRLSLLNGAQPQPMPSTPFPWYWSRSLALNREGLRALLERRQDSHLIVQHLLSDQLLVPPPGRGLLWGRFPMLPQSVMQLLLLPDRLV